MTLKDFRIYYGLNEAFKMLRVLGYHNYQNMNERGWIDWFKDFKKTKKYTKEQIDFVEYDSIKELISVMSFLNSGVKYVDVPSKNLFYKAKHKVIKYLLSNNLIDNIVESENYYRFDTMGYSFHQPKSHFKDSNFTITEKEDYNGFLKTELNQSIFESLKDKIQEDYKNFMLSVKIQYNL